MADNDPVRHRYTLVVEYDTIGDEDAALSEDIEADVMYGGLHNYYGVVAQVTRGPELAVGDWHQAVVQTADPTELCLRCGVRADRAVHDAKTAAAYGVRF